MWRAKMRNICAIDLDGVLNYYPDCWVDFINRETGLNFKDKGECKKVLTPKEYALLKDKYRKSEFKANLRIRKSALELLRHLKDEGYFIVIVTRRPFEGYPSLFDMTRKWLEKNNVPFDVLEKKSISLLKKYPRLDFYVEDELEDANLIAKRGYKVFLFQKECNEGVMHQNVIRIKSLKEILSYLSERCGNNRND
jgi:uncharacterized HAD superfamily protein